ncbi:MAG: metallophosphoesterase [Treponemataceae bacterium]|nr:MAG: metallophosphoesterase [Treponemataceae bacterium]
MPDATHHARCYPQAATAVVVFIFAFAILSFFSCKTITVAAYELDARSASSVGRTDSGTEKSAQIRIVLITDLHSTIFGENQSTLVGKVLEQEPDLVLLAGDIYDDKTPHDGTRLLLSGLQPFAAQNAFQIFYVPGNHEYATREHQALFAELQTFGVTVLQDSFVERTVNGRRLVIAGIDDPIRKKLVDKMYDQDALAKKVFSPLAEKTDSYKILIAHRPEKVKLYRQLPFDLIVSGHAHGGQVIIPHILNGLYAPHQGFFPKYAGGLYKHSETLTHIVSRGLCVNRVPRIGNPPELVVITLRTAASAAKK